MLAFKVSQCKHSLLLLLYSISLMFNCTTLSYILLQFLCLFFYSYIVIGPNYTPISESSSNAIFSICLSRIFSGTSEKPLFSLPTSFKTSFPAHISQQSLFSILSNRALSSSYPLRLRVLQHNRIQ